MAFSTSLRLPSQVNLRTDFTFAGRGTEPELTERSVDVDPPRIAHIREEVFPTFRYSAARAVAIGRSSRGGPGSSGRRRSVPVGLGAAPSTRRVLHVLEERKRAVHAVAPGSIRCPTPTRDRFVHIAPIALRRSTSRLRRTTVKFVGSVLETDSSPVWMFIAPMAHLVQTCR